MLAECENFNDTFDGNWEWGILFVGCGKKTEQYNDFVWIACINLK